MGVRRSGVVARRLARERKAAADAARSRREGRVEELMAEFFAARIPRDEALAAVQEHEQAMGAVVVALTGQGEPVGRVRELLDLGEREYGRLRKLATRQDTEPEPGSVSVAVPAVSPADQERQRVVAGPSAGDTGDAGVKV